MNNVIDKSKYDKYDYKYLTLDNGLEVMYIFRDDIEVSCASMIVDVGTINDNGVYGLAHFLEHMLFMGNKKYPNGNEYFEYISKHGGKTNAFTDVSHTCYHFYVGTRYFEKSLDMFCNFFIEPLFDKNCIDREINAIDSEYHKNKNIDSYRYQRCIKLLAPNTHPFSNFDVGSRGTLNIPNIRDELIKLYGCFYVSNNMKLIIVSNKKYDQSTLNMFNLIPMDKSESFLGYHKFDDPLMDNKIIRYIPNSKSNVLLLCWSIKRSDISNMSCILDYIYFMIGREMDGTLSNILTGNALIETINMAKLTSVGEHDIIYIEIVLTDFGYNNLDVIITIILKYFENLRENTFELNEKYRKIFKLYSKCMMINFTFEETQQSYEKMMDIVNNVCAENLSLMNSVTSKHKICRYSKYINQLYNQILQSFTYSRMNVVIGSQRCINNTNMRDRYYNFEYSVSPLSELSLYTKQFIINFNSVVPINERFIPNKLIIYKNKDEYEIPIRLDTPMELWFKYEKNGIPKVFTLLEIGLADMNNIDIQMKYMMYIENVKKKLNGELYDAILCDVKFSIEMVQSHILIGIMCFNDKLHNILDCIVNTLLDVHMDYHTFGRIKGECTEILARKQNNPMFENLNDNIENIFYKNSKCIGDKINALQKITFIGMQKFKFTSFSYMKCFIDGNMTKNECMNVREPLNKIYKLSINNSNMYDEFNDTKNKKIFKLINNIKNDANSLCCVIIQTNRCSYKDIKFIENYTLSLLTNKILNNYFFNQLRTIKQLGYIVKSDVETFGTNESIVVQKYYVQSSKLIAEESHKHILLFLIDMFHKIISTLTNEKFKKYIESCIITINNKKNTLTDKASEMYIHVHNNSYLFNTKKMMIDYLNKLTINDLILFYQKYVYDTNNHIVILQNKK